MENASKALLMAAEILLGVIFLSLFVFGYYGWERFAGEINTNLEQTEIQEFNAKFLKYNEKDNLTAHDVVTIVSMAHEYNVQIGDTGYPIEITGNAIRDISTVMADVSNYIKTNMDKLFKVVSITYNDYTKKVGKIEINKIP